MTTYFLLQPNNTPQSTDPHLRIFLKASGSGQLPLTAVIANTSTAPLRDLGPSLYQSQNSRLKSELRQNLSPFVSLQSHKNCHGIVDASVRVNDQLLHHRVVDLDLLQALPICNMSISYFF